MPMASRSGTDLLIVLTGEVFSIQWKEGGRGKRGVSEGVWLWYEGAKLSPVGAISSMFSQNADAGAELRMIWVYWKRQARRRAK